MQTTFRELDPAQRRALAESVTVSPETEAGRAAALAIIAEGPPEARTVLESGARWLELGCGVAGMLLATACHYPDLRGVGVDIAPDLLDVARGRAQRLGVGDRIRFVECDASTFTDTEPFDIVFWSQSFFPAGTREAALQNAFARLRPGGLLLVPALPGNPEPPDTDGNTIVVSPHGAPVLSGDELAKEMTAAGFAGVRENRGDLAITMVARRD